MRKPSLALASLATGCCSTCLLFLSLSRIPQLGNTCAHPPPFQLSFGASLEGRFGVSIEPNMAAAGVQEGMVLDDLPGPSADLMDEDRIGGGSGRPKRRR